MEDKIIEQPVLETEQIQNNFDSENQDGSIYGKFKDVKSLLDAYNNLEAEFTRKSQKLAEFQKEYGESAFFQNNETLDEFLNKSGMDEYKKDIEEILINDNEINNLPNRYQIALKIAKSASNKSANLLNNPEYLDKYIFSNNEIKEKIISDYLSNLNNISQSPKVIAGNSTNIYFSPNENKPRTVKEAGEIFSKMLK